MQGFFERSARTLAILGGLLVLGIALLTTGSVLARWAAGHPLNGDTEIVEYAMAIAIACFLPWCQWRRGNLIVDFFTTRVSPRSRQQLDRIGAALMAAMLTLLAWRTAAGALDQYRYGAETMLLRWPLWPVYAAMALPLALTALMATWSALTGRWGPPPEPTADTTHRMAG